jgi:type I restriction enzyme S subunit
MSGEVRQGTIYSATNFITAIGLKNSTAKMFPPGTVLIALYGATAGQVAVLGFEAATNQAICGILPNQHLVPDFLSYALQAQHDGIVAQAVGNAQPNLSQIKVRDLQIPVPPLPEQRRIVAILDEAFEGIAAAKANAEKNLRNAKEACDARLHKAMAAAKDSCSCTTLGALCDFKNGDRGKNYPSKDARVTEGVPFINAGHLKEDGLDLSEMDYISRDRFALLGAGKIRPHDILFCLRGSLGKFASVGRLAEGAIASSLVILRPKAGVSPEFISAYLGSHICSAMIEQNRNGAAQPNLSAKSVAAFAVPKMPLAEQEQIAALSCAAQADRNALQGCIRHKCAALDELQSSLLHQAFTGNL